MTAYTDWVAKYPQAAAELASVLGAVPWAPFVEHDSKSEAWAQQQIRLQVAHRGGLLWRNNVGATPSKIKCEHCNGVTRQTPLRYGLANDSAKLNAAVKSHDLVGVLPRIITHDDVGQTFGQFISVEAKRPGWTFDPKSEHEQAQAAWGALVKRFGGLAQFSTGVIEL